MDLLASQRVRAVHVNKNAICSRNTLNLQGHTGVQVALNVAGRESNKIEQEHQTADRYIFCTSNTTFEPFCRLSTQAVLSSDESVVGSGLRFSRRSGLRVWFNAELFDDSVPCLRALLEVES